MKIIKLTNKLEVFVDDEDFEYLNQFKWCFDNGYAITTKVPQIKMHRLIMKVGKGIHIDHKNHNTLDNRKNNLRICTNSQNHMNRIKQRMETASSKFKGVCWHKDRNKWEAYITKDQKLKYLGLFDDETEAAKTYDFWAKKLFGEFARLNFI